MNMVMPRLGRKNKMPLGYSTIEAQSLGGRNSSYRTASGVPEAGFQS